MASHFQIQKPYVLTTLPRPLDPTTGRYAVSEVYGSTPGSKKRKRAELTVGTDGDSINIYEVSEHLRALRQSVPPISNYWISTRFLRPDLLRRTQFLRRLALPALRALFGEGTSTAQMWQGTHMFLPTNTPLTRSLSSKILLLAPVRPLRKPNR